MVQADAPTYPKATDNIKEFYPNPSDAPKLQKYLNLIVKEHVHFGAYHLLDLQAQMCQ